jgi:hypothetical protein
MVPAVIGKQTCCEEISEALSTWRINVALARDNSNDEDKVTAAPTLLQGRVARGASA